MTLPFDIQRCTGYQPNEPFGRTYCLQRLDCRRFLDRDQHGPRTPIAHATRDCHIKIEVLPDD